MKSLFLFILLSIIALISYTSRGKNFINNRNNIMVNSIKSKDNYFTNVLIVTLSEPTEFMLQRAVDYQKYKSSYLDVWYIFDRTTSYEIPNKFKQFFKTNVYNFNSRDYSGRYPNINELLSNCYRLRKYKSGEEYRYIAYMTLAERVNELFQLNHLNTKYLWVIEQDSAITGNLTRFMNHFDYFEEDFIGRDIRPVAKIYNSTLRYWYGLSKCLTNNFIKIMAGKYLCMANIYFSRFSKKYMQFMDMFLKNNYHGSSEIIYPMVALYYNLSYMSFPERYIYKKSNWATRFTMIEYKTIKNEYLIHSLKE